MGEQFSKNAPPHARRKHALTSFQVSIVALVFSCLQAALFASCGLIAVSRSFIKPTAGKPAR